MRAFSPDTSDEAHALQVDLYRRLTPAERIDRVVRIRTTVDDMALASIRRHYPEDDDRRCQLRLASRRYDRSLMIAAFGWDPDREGR